MGPRWSSMTRPVGSGGLPRTVGHDTRDRLGGERGPAGPRYERDGAVRASWADPVGSAGLAKVAPNMSGELANLRLRAEQLDARLAELAHEASRGETPSLWPPPVTSQLLPRCELLAEQERLAHAVRMEQVQLQDERRRVAALLTTAVPQPSDPTHISPTAGPPFLPHQESGLACSPGGRWSARRSSPQRSEAWSHPLPESARRQRPSPGSCCSCPPRGPVRGQFVAVLVRYFVYLVLVVGVLLVGRLAVCRLRAPVRGRRHGPMGQHPRGGARG